MSRINFYYDDFSLTTLKFSPHISFITTLLKCSIMKLNFRNRSYKSYYHLSLLEFSILHQEAMKVWIQEHCLFLMSLILRHRNKTLSSRKNFLVNIKHKNVFSFKSTDIPHYLNPVLKRYWIINSKTAGTNIPLFKRQKKKERIYS